MARRKLWQERKAKSPEQYVEDRLLSFADNLFRQLCTEGGINTSTETTWSADGIQTPSKRLLKLRVKVEERTLAELRSFRGDAAEIAKGRDIDMQWNAYRPVRVKFKIRSVVDRLAGLVEGEEPASG